MKFASVLLQLVAVTLAVPAGNARNEDANVDHKKISLGTRQEKMPETSGIMSGKGVWAPKLAYATVFFVRHFVLMMPRAGFLKKEEAEPQFGKPGAQRTKLYYGPFSLPAVDPKNPTKGTSFNNRVDQIPTDVSLLSTKIYLVNEDMTPTSINDGITARHVAFADTTQNPQFTYSCPNSTSQPSYPLSVFAGLGEDQEAYEYANRNSDIDSGYYLPRGWALLLTSELVNYRSAPKNVYIVLDMEYKPGKAAFFASSEILSLDTCSGVDTVRKGVPGQTRFETKSSNITVAYDGFLIGLHGHMRDGGVEVPIYINGKIACESKANYGGGWQEEGALPTLSSMTKCNRPIPVKANDVVTLQAVYDYGLHPSRSFALGSSSVEIVGNAIFTFATKAGIL